MVVLGHWELKDKSHEGGQNKRERKRERYGRTDRQRDMRLREHVCMSEKERKRGVVFNYMCIAFSLFHIFVPLNAMKDH